MDDCKLLLLLFIYLFCGLIEYKSVTFSEPPNNSITSDVNDPFVQNEIKKSNELNEKVQINNNKEEKYSVRIQNLKKIYKKK